MRLSLKLDEQTFERLMKAAEADRRPLAWEAEWLLKEALEQLSKEPGEREDQRCQN